MLVGLKFSKELYYKISVVTMEVPALRERKEDIPGTCKTITTWFKSEIWENSVWFY